MSATESLQAAATVSAVEAIVSTHLGRAWRVESTTDLGDRSSHPAMVFTGDSLSVFAKRADSVDQLQDELDGLELLHRDAGVAVPVPVGSGVLSLPDGSAVLLTEALVETVPEDRTRQDWEAIGRTLGELHQVRGSEFGLERDGWFGPLHQDNRPVVSGSWADFYAQRRLLPWLATAATSGGVPVSVLSQVEQLVERLPSLVGPEPEPRLLHGDAQHHNFVSTPSGAVVIDASPYYGHPEIDLALLDYFVPVPAVTFEAYAEVNPVAPEFEERRELWRIFAYLAVLTVDSRSDWARQFVGRLDGALARYL
ncbi:MAG: fructosamine kinase family protein [Propionibacteriaceae bacterium]